MSTRYALLIGALLLLPPLSLGACAADGDAQYPEERSADADGCLNELLSEGASFEEGEPPNDYVWQESGLGLFDRTLGAGPVVQAGDTVTFSYVGYLLDGCAFDATELRGPFTAPLDAMVPGMREGLIGMQVGGHRRFYVPPELAYGEQGAGDMIGPNEVLVFDVQLLELP